jgi:sugar O-acyltransferase (sialic acid O-acetyltransferase NeuD family)
MRKLISIIGYSGHSYSCLDTAIANKIVVVDYFDIEEKEFNPYSLTFQGQETKIKFESIFIAVGDNRLRQRIFNDLPITCKFDNNIIHPNSNISDKAKINYQVLIQNGAQINALATIDTGVIINTGAIIEHECKIGAFSHIAPGAVLAGNVFVGERSFIGANATIIQGVKIGKDVVIGAGAVIINDIPDNAVVVGNPGKIIKYQI